jgi:hypothetical protein
LCKCVVVFELQCAIISEQASTNNYDASQSLKMQIDVVFHSSLPL